MRWRRGALKRAEPAAGRFGRWRAQQPPCLQREQSTSVRSGQQLKGVKQRSCKRREPEGGPNGAWRRRAQRRVLNKAKFPEAEPAGAGSAVQGRRARTLNRSPEAMSGAPAGRES